MDLPIGERTAENRRRLADARQSQINVLRELAETEDELAATFERLVRNGGPTDRRAALARQAREQAERLRHYAGRLHDAEERSSGPALSNG